MGIPPGASRPGAFTLLELLVVVAVIAILVAFAVPNFLEAQVRAKVARTRADLRTVVTGLEAYHVDFNAYPPNDGVYNVLPIQITTPIAYLTSVSFRDPFNNRELDPMYGELAQFYTYQDIVTWDEFVASMIMTPNEAIDDPFYNDGAKDRFGEWRLIGWGPDMEYGSMSLFPGQYPEWGADILYDATNGTISWGNLLRTQLHAEGVVGE